MIAHEKAAVFIHFDLINHNRESLMTKAIWNDIPGSSESKFVLTAECLGRWLVGAVQVHLPNLY